MSPEDDVHRAVWRQAESGTWTLVGRPVRERVSIKTHIKLAVEVQDEP